jgi:hypothetical protein
MLSSRGGWRPARRRRGRGRSRRRGVFTLLQATAITDRWGAAHYGHLTGLLSAPLTITMALAPFGVTALASAVGGYAVTFLLLSAAAAIAAALSLATIPKPSRKDQHS